ARDETGYIATQEVAMPVTRGCGASDASPRNDPAGLEWGEDVAPGGRHPEAQPVEYPTAPVAVRHVGYEGLYDGRRIKPSPKRAPVAEVERILRLSRDRYRRFNGRHFYDLARREHGVTLTLHLRETPAPTGGLAPQATAPRPASPPARAPALLRRV